MNDLTEFRNQAKAVPLVVGFAVVVLGSFSLVFLKDLREVLGAGFLVGVLFSSGLIFAIQNQIWKGSCHPLEKMPRGGVIVVSLSAASFVGYAAYAWELGWRLLYDAFNADLRVYVDGIYGAVGAVFAALMFILAGIRMSRYIYLRILITIPIVVSGMVPVLMLFYIVEDNGAELNWIANQLAGVGAFGCGVFLLCLAWAAPIFLYLWKYRNYKELVEEVEADPDYL